MHEDYDDHDDYDYDDNPDNLENQYKHYFKFDPEAWDAWGEMLYDALNDLVEYQPNVWYIHGFPFKSIPVNSYFSDTGKDKTFQYWGNNYDGVGVWKKKYFISDPINDNYKKHVSANAIHFLQQPSYYKGLFDIMN